MNYLIKDYIKKLTIDDIKKFAKTKNINISDTDAIILYTYAKNNYEEIINGNDQDIIKELRKKLSPDTFKEVYKLYLEYKVRYIK